MELIKFSEEKCAIEFNKEESPVPVAVKKFRKSPELKSFYKFIYENDLRQEAFLVINSLFKSRKNTKRHPAKK